MNNNLTLNFFSVKESVLTGEKVSACADESIYITLKLNNLVIVQMLFLIEKNKIYLAYTLKSNYQMFHYMETIEMHDVLFNKAYQCYFKLIISYLKEKIANNSFENEDKFTETNLKKILLQELEKKLNQEVN